MFHDLVDQVVVMLCFRLVLHDLVDQMVVMLYFKLLLHDVVDRVDTVGAKKKFPYGTLLLPYLTVLESYFDRTRALLFTYFRRTLTVLLPHPLTHCNRTTAVLSPYLFLILSQPQQIDRRVRVVFFLRAVPA